LPLKTGRRKPRSIPEAGFQGAANKKMRMLRFVLIIAWLAGASWAAAETIDVKYYGKLDLAPFACTDITRSSFINRACYDKTQQFMVVQLRSAYYPYCEMAPTIFDAFLAAPSMGQYYNANIKGSGSDGPFDCRTHRAPKY
jgi:KTSC domain